MDLVEWTAPRDLGRPLGGQVHLWRARLDAAPDTLNALFGVLAPDEQARAARLRTAAKRAEFVQGRAILREILGRYLHVAPEIVPLTYSPTGKPHLPDPAPLSFNLAHSSGWAVFAVSGGPEVGVDVEHVERVRPHLTLARRYFALAEAQALEAAAVHEQADVFYRCWTCKEAWVKARGDGMNFPLDRFTVRLGTGVDATIETVQGAPEEPPQWRLRTFTVDVTHVAACAVRAPQAAWDFLDYSPE